MNVNFILCNTRPLSSSPKECWVIEACGLAAGRQQSESENLVVDLIQETVDRVKMMRSNQKQGTDSK